jgi:N-acetyltransferase
VLLPLSHLDVSLYPMAMEHVAALRHLVQSKADGTELWRNRFLHIPSPSFVDRYVEAAMRQFNAEKEEPYVVVASNGNVLGTTRLQAINLNNKRLDIGSTWIHPNARGTRLNSVGKLLLLDRAFEKLQVLRVGFTVHPDNLRSRQALIAIGANFEGVLRNFQMLHGQSQDMCSYSLIKADWPCVREKLLSRIERLSGYDVHASAVDFGQLDEQLS